MCGFILWIGHIAIETVEKYDEDVSVMILGSLRKIKDINWIADTVEESLLSSLAKRKVSVKQVFDTLNLKHTAWVRYVVKVIDTLQPEEKKVVMQLVNGYGIKGLEKMLVALTLNGVGEDLQPKLMSTVVEIWKTNHQTYEDIVPILDEILKIFCGPFMTDGILQLRKDVRNHFKPPY